MTPLQTTLQTISDALKVAGEAANTIERQDLSVLSGGSMFKLGFLVGSVFRLQQDLGVVMDDLKEVSHEVRRC